MSINRVVLSGNLVRDAELKYLGDLPLVSFSLAVNEREKVNGEWTDRPSYFDCTYVGKRAEGVQKFLAKGLHVTIEGRLRQDRWEKDGAKHSRVIVRVDELELPPRQKGESAASSAPTGYDGTDEDIPF